MQQVWLATSGEIPRFGAYAAEKSWQPSEGRLSLPQLREAEIIGAEMQYLWLASIGEIFGKGKKRV